MDISVFYRYLFPVRIERATYFSQRSFYSLLFLLESINITNNHEFQSRQPDRQ